MLEASGKDRVLEQRLPWAAAAGAGVAPLVGLGRCSQAGAELIFKFLECSPD